MKILHIWDCAGVAGVIAKYQRREGHISHVIKRAGYDYFGIDKFYNTEILNVTGNQFRLECLKRAKGYDIIHVHAYYKLVKWLRILYPFKKIFLHYHGTDIRTKTRQHIIAQFMSSENFVSTKDLISYCKVYPAWIPTPVDYEHFREIDTSLNHSWLSMYDNRSFDTSINIREHTIHLDRKTQFIPYPELPDFLKQFKGFIDVKYVNRDGNKLLLESLSSLGLQCLAMGLQVIDYKGEKLSNLPYYHYPEFTVELLDSFYKGYNEDIPQSNFLDKSTMVNKE